MDTNGPFKSVQTGGGVRPRIGAASLGPVGRPGPIPPGLARLWNRNAFSAPAGPSLGAIVNVDSWFVFPGDPLILKIKVVEY